MMIIPVKQGYAWRISQKWGNDNFDGRTPYGTLSDSMARPHNGVDLAILNGTPLVYPYDCQVVKVVNDSSYGGGYGCSIWFITEPFNGIRYLMILGHLMEGQVLAKEGIGYKQGELVGLSDNTGFSTGPHTHWNVQPIVKDYDSPLVFNFGEKWGVINWEEKTSGSIDPMLLLTAPNEIYPVDLRYDQEKSNLREKLWSIKYNEKLVINQAQKLGFGPTEWARMKNAFVYGYWDRDFVMNVANFQVWKNMTKPEFNRRINK